LKPAFVPPRDAIEAQVAEVFSEVLGIDNVGAFDNFFALGGDSIRGFQTLTRLRTRLQVELPIFELFEARPSRKSRKGSQPCGGLRKMPPSSAF
jgi:acyl carrier protein